MLLSDWVFSQSPKAVKEVATALMTPNSILRLSAPDSEWSGEPPIQVPLRFGGKDVFERVFQLLEEPQRHADKGRRFAEIAAGQADSAEVDSRWIASPLRQTDVVSWLRVGLYLGALARVDKLFIQAAIATFH
jgi:hypothetical protein